MTSNDHQSVQSGHTDVVAADQSVRPNAGQSSKPAKSHLLRTLLHSLREYKRDTLLAPLFVAIEGVVEIVIPTVMAELIDQGISGGSMPIIIKFGLILIGCALLSLFTGLLSGRYAAVAAAGFAKNLRHDLFK